MLLPFCEGPMVSISTLESGSHNLDIPGKHKYITSHGQYNLLASNCQLWGQNNLIDIKNNSKKLLIRLEMSINLMRERDQE